MSRALFGITDNRLRNGGGGGGASTGGILGYVDYHEMSLDVRDASAAFQALVLAGDSILDYHEISLDVQVSPIRTGIETDLL